MDRGSVHELLIAKFRLKLKKVEKTTKSFRYDLNQIPYDYTVEVRNRFKGLDLIDKVPDELWMEVHDIVQETGIKTIPKKKKCKKAKWLSEEDLQISRSMNQGKLEVVKQEMERVNVNILGIMELKWTGMGELNSDDHYIYYCEQESLRKNGVAITVNKRVQMQCLDAISKMME